MLQLDLKGYNYIKEAGTRRFFTKIGVPQKIFQQYYCSVIALKIF